MEGRELASVVSTKEPYFFGDESAPIKVAALDLGVKKSILQNIANQGVYLKVFPYDTDFATLAAWNPDGYFLSNGQLIQNLYTVHKLSQKKSSIKISLFLEFVLGIKLLL